MNKTNVIIVGDNHRSQHNNIFIVGYYLRIQEDSSGKNKIFTLYENTFHELQRDIRLDLVQFLTTQTWTVVRNPPEWAYRSLEGEKVYRVF